MDSEYRPFGNFWLDSAVQETLVPGKEWDKLQEKITDLLVQKLRSSLVDDVKRRAIFIVLGRKFCTLHFPQYPFEEVEMMNRNTASYSYGTLWEEKVNKLLLIIFLDIFGCYLYKCYLYFSFLRKVIFEVLLYGFHRFLEPDQVFVERTVSSLMIFLSL